MTPKIGEIVSPDGITWEVYQEDNGLVSVEKDAPNGSEDDVYACLDDLKEGLLPGYTFEEVQE